MTVFIHPVEASAPGGQRHTEAVFLAVFELAIDGYVGLGVLAVVLVDIKAAVVTDAAGAVVDIELLRGDFFGADELDLLGLPVTQRGLQRKRIHVELIEFLSLDLWSGSRIRHRHCIHFVATSVRLFLYLVHVTSDELDCGVFEARPCVVFDGDPAGQSDFVAFLGQHEIVVGLP